MSDYRKDLTINRTPIIVYGFIYRPTSTSNCIIVECGPMQLRLGSSEDRKAFIAALQEADAALDAADSKDGEAA